MAIIPRHQRKKLCSTWVLSAGLSLLLIFAGYLIDPHDHVKLGSLISYSVSVQEDLTTTLLETERLPFSDQESYLNHYSKRDLTWATAVQKGNSLLCLMQQTASQATQALGRDSQSAFTNVGDLGSWGWGEVTSEDYTITSFLEDEEELIESKLPLGNSDNSNFYPLYLSHSRQTIHNGISYQATGAYYKSIFDIADGYIIASNNKSPENAAPDFANLDPPQPWPLLARWSDVVFLQWVYLNGGTLKGIVRQSIINEDTEEIIDEALGKAGISQPTFDEDVVFSLTDPATSEYAKAMLGTPNGGGCAWLLINHKSQFGQRMIESIQVWKSEGSYNLLFNIIDVPEEDAASVI